MNDYNKNKAKLSYDLKVDHKFFKKSRAFILDSDNNLLAIKVHYTDGQKPDEYLIPGGGVDEGETSKQAAIREAEEEYNVKVKILAYLGKNYYHTMINYEGEEFKSNRVEYYYLCKVVETEKSDHMGIDGEFQEKNREYKKVKLSLDEVKKIEPKLLNNVNPKTYKRIIEIMENRK